MGGAPSTQDDLLCLKQRPASDDKRQQAFRRLRRSLAPALAPDALQRVVAELAARRFAAWPRPPPGASRLAPAALADRVRGCLFGAALGDAAGLATEFLSKADVAEFYGTSADFAPGTDVLPDEHRMMWCSGDWTDDTDQQVVLVQSLLATGGCALPRVFAAGLDVWRRGGFPELGDQSGGGLGQTTKAVMNDRRFLEDPEEAAAAHSKAPTNGGVMRTAAAGFPEFWDEDVVARQAAVLCRTTHANPRSVASCVAVAVAVARLLQGADVDDGEGFEASVVAPALERGAALLAESDEGSAAADELLAHCRARSLGELVLDEPRKIGYTLKCLGAGFWGLRSSAGFRSALNELIYEGGDADTNGSVAGALLGCRLGYSQLPTDWIEGMPYSSWIEAYVQHVLVSMGLPAEPPVAGGSS